jgi:hypothetical protein
MMTQWEYTHACSGLPQRDLSDYGRQGWELVSVVHNVNYWYFYFKRPIHSTNAGVNDI